MKVNITTQIVLGLTLSLLVSVKTVAQQPDFLFEHSYPYPIPHGIRYEAPYSCILEIAPEGIADGFYLITASDAKSYSLFESDSIFSPILYKVSYEGEVMGELTLGYDNRYCMISALYAHPNDSNCCLAVGITHDNELHLDRAFLAKIDYDMNLLWQKEIEAPEPYKQVWGESYLDSDNNLMYYSICQDSISGQGQNTTLFYQRMSPEGEVDTVFLAQPYFGSFASELFEYQDGSGDYGQIIMETENDFSLIRIDREMHFIDKQPLPTKVNLQNTGSFFHYLLTLGSPFFTTASLQKGSMVIINEAFLSIEDTQHQWTDEDVIGFIRFDQNLELVSYSAIGHGESDSLRSIQGPHSLCMVGDDTFYIFYVQGAPGGWGYDWSDCFAVVKMDINGNVIWRRFWDRYLPEFGMKIYVPTSITTTHDDGCLVAGYCYHSDINGDELDPEVFLLKFYSDGSLSVPEMERFVRPYCFYPNPVKEQLQMQFSPDVQPAQVELYDLQGRLVRTQCNSFEQIDLGQLPTGTYTMRVIMEDGKAYSDKVVKE